MLFIILLTYIIGVLSTRKCRTEWRDDFSQQSGYSQMTEVNGILYVAGQVGFGPTGLPDDLESQIQNTFDNIENVLSQAGATINDAFLLRSYLVNETANILLRDLKLQRYPNWFPAWTAINVKELFFPDILVEFEVYAKKPKKRPTCQLEVLSF